MPFSPSDWQKSERLMMHFAGEDVGKQIFWSTVGGNDPTVCNLTTCIKIMSVDILWHSNSPSGNLSYRDVWTCAKWCMCKVIHHRIVRAKYREQSRLLSKLGYIQTRTFCTDFFFNNWGSFLFTDLGSAPWYNGKERHRETWKWHPHNNAVQQSTSILNRILIHCHGHGSESWLEFCFRLLISGPVWACSTVLLPGPAWSGNS